MPAKRKRALACASPMELERALQLFVKNWVREHGSAVDEKKHPFELFGYKMLEFGASPDGASLAKLAPLLGLLLSVAANAVVNQKSLEVALRQIAAAERDLQLLQPQMTEAHWTSWLAGQLRTALSHCRRLRLKPKLMQQTLRKMAGCYHAELQELVAAVNVEEADVRDVGEDGSAEAVALAEELVDAASSAETAPKTPMCKRRVRRKTADDRESAAEPLLDGSPAAAVALSTPRRRRLWRKESEASVDFNSLLSSPVAEGSGSAGSGSAVTVTPGQCGLLMNLLTAAPRPAGLGAQGAQVSSFCQKKTAAAKTAGVRKRCEAAAPSTAALQTMWYKSSNAVAVRERGGRQLFQIALKGASREQLEALAEQCCEKLKEGATVQEAKAWAEVQKQSVRVAETTCEKGQSASLPPELVEPPSCEAYAGAEEGEEEEAAEDSELETHEPHEIW